MSRPCQDQHGQQSEGEAAAQGWASGLRHPSCHPGRCICSPTFRVFWKLQGLVLAAWSWPVCVVCHALSGAGSDRSLKDWHSVLLGVVAGCECAHAVT